VDVRLVAATARDLAADVKSGRFREDLYYRLNVVGIHLPPLRERSEDVAPLARHFAARLGSRVGHPVTLSQPAIGWLQQQRWPGNVRELENAIERAAVMSDKEMLEPEDFASRLPSPGSSGKRDGGSGTGPQTLRDAVEAAERDAITAALARSAGNRREAAQALGVSLRTLFYKIERYGLG
jgi:DNA-binding NtrC family response regulator